MPLDDQRGRAPWIGALALAALVAGLLLAVQHWRPQSAPDTAPPPVTMADPKGDTLEQALRIARGDSASGEPQPKDRWLNDLKGFNILDLSDTRRAALLRLANAERCTCGCGYTLAGCRAYDPTCPVSGPRVQRLLDSVRAGRVPDQPLRARRASR